MVAEAKGERPSFLPERVSRRLNEPDSKLTITSTAVIAVLLAGGSIFRGDLATVMNLIPQSENLAISAVSGYISYYLSTAAINIYKFRGNQPKIESDIVSASGTISSRSNES